MQTFIRQLSPLSTALAAFLLSFILPSCGHFWLRCYAWGLSVIGALLIGVGVFCLSGWVFVPAYGELFLVVLLGVYGVNVVSAFILGWRLCKRKKLKVQLLAVMAILAIGFALLIKFKGILFGAQVFYIPSKSMEPTLNIGDYVLVDVSFKGADDIQAGDIVVFTRTGESDFYIKRVVAKPGDSLRSGEKQLWVNGELKYSNLIELANFSTTLGCNDYYVVGDNYQVSYDSRHWGLLNRAQIVGVYRYTIGNLTRTRVKKDTELKIRQLN